MRRFRRFFAMLFAASVLLGAMHEVLHDHHHDMEGHYEQSCPLYLLSQTPSLLADTTPIPTIVSVFEPFVLLCYGDPSRDSIPPRTRSPPLA
jgi:hypothetical protein